MILGFALYLAGCFQINQSKYKVDDHLMGALSIYTFSVTLFQHMCNSCCEATADEDDEEASP
jgi:FtsH-binding integral membrane protein